VGELLALFGVSVASALFPLINIEAYLGVREAVTGIDTIWLPSFVAALGQSTGKIVWYWIGGHSLGWGWIRRRVERPRAKARLELWQRRTNDRPVLAGLLVMGSSVTGFPPLAVISVLAGQLRMNLPWFLVIVLVGRWIRFAAVLGSAGYLTDLLTS
jgi:membrane protein YqaA with SNARE-associated domain